MLVLYNTLTRRKENFQPISGRKVGVYACGITAYFSAHIGNMRTYVQEDVIRRVLIHDGFSVTHVQNITDVGHLVSDADTGEDKLRLEAEKEHKTMRDVSAFYTGLFLKDMGLLNIQKPEVMPKASDHIPEMLRLVKSLDQKGYLYKAENGMYFDTSKFKGYGALASTSFQQLTASLKEGARVEKVAGKRNITDFAVWRFAHGGEREMIWDSEWGRGFPGWHIECSAMSMKYLGEHFDIHFGGVDHIPIHHTNEIAQSEASTGKKFVNYWMHMQFLTVEGGKMAKSVRNIYTVQEIVDRGYSPLALRFFLLSGHYRQTLNFTFEALSNAQNTLNGIYAFLGRLASAPRGGGGLAGDGFVDIVGRCRKDFFMELDNDINMPAALSSMHSIINAANPRIESAGMSEADAKAVIDAMLDIDTVLGLGFSERLSRGKEELNGEIQGLVDERESARKAKDFTRSDELRRLLKEKYHVVLEDTKHGIKWHREA